jgi:hypothetical protein
MAISLQTHTKTPPQTQILWLKNCPLLPHSHCSHRENPKFLQNFISKYNTLKEIFGQKSVFNICHCNSGLAFKCKNYCIASHNFVYFIRENSPKAQVSFVNESPGLTKLSLVDPWVFCSTVSTYSFLENRVNSAVKWPKFYFYPLL